MKNNLILLGALLLFPLTFIPLKAAESWQTTLKQELPLLGHRNWICIVDSAYPLQTSPGVETIATGADELVVLKTVLYMLSKTKHVQPVIYTDSEMAYVPEADAPGIVEYRKDLAHALKGNKAQVLLHEQMIKQLGDVAKEYHVLILKTNLTLPYTSVFLRLQCGYWNDAAEARLRAAMK